MSYTAKQFLTITIARDTTGSLSHSFVHDWKSSGLWNDHHLTGKIKSHCYDSSGPLLIHRYLLRTSRKTSARSVLYPTQKTSKKLQVFEKAGLA